MWSHVVMMIAMISSLTEAQFVNSCSYKNCRWDLVRDVEDASKVIVQDSSIHNVNWKWEVRGGHWNVTYSMKYPSEWYSGKAVFVNSSVGRNAFVSWGSNVPWMSNTVPIYYATPWNLTYNGDVLGFVPTRNGRYYFQIYSRNKRHDPFGRSRPIAQPCVFTSENPNEVSNWWRDQKTNRVCPNPTLNWYWQGKNGKWTVQYSYIDNTRRTICDLYYQGNGLPQLRVIKWELDEIKESVTYVTNPIRIYEDAWQASLGYAEVWGFTPTGNGLWIFQHFSRNLVFQPFQNLRGTFMYGGRNSPRQSAPMYYTVGTSGQRNPVYTVGSPISSPIYPAGTAPVYQIGTPITNPTYTYTIGQPAGPTQVYTIDGRG